MTLLENAAALVLLGGVLLVGCCLGCRILVFFRLEHPSEAERLALAAGLGLGVFSLAMALAGFLGQLRPWAAWAILGLAALAGAREAPAVLRAIRFSTIARIWADVAPQARPLAVVLALAMPIYALAATAPPLEGDSLAGYLSVPSAFVRAGAIHPIDHKWYDDLPLNVQMLTSLALLLQSDILAQLLSGFGMAMLGVLAVYALSRRWFSPTVFVVAASTYLLLGEVAYGNASTKADLGWAFFELLLLLSFGAWLSTRNDRWLLLAGVFSGLSLGAKYTGAYSLAVLGATLIVVQARESWNGRAVGRLILFFLPATVLGSIWLIKNALFTGNPIFPLFHEWFGAEPLIQSVRHASSLSGMVTIWWDMSVGYVTGSFGKPVGPIILALLPGALLVPRLPASVRLLLGYAAAFSVIWYFGIQYPRNLLPALAALALVAGYVFERLIQERALLRRALPLVLLVPLTLALVEYARVNLFSINRLAYAAGLVSREAFLSRHLGPLYPDYAMTQYVNANLPTQARILALMNGNDYYLLPAYVQSNELSARAVHAADTEERLVDELRKLSISHVFVNDYVLDLYRRGYGTHAPYRPTLLEQSSFQTTYMEQVFASGPQRLYRLRLDGPP